MIDEVLRDSNYLIPYFKQFINIINSKNILDYSNKHGIIYNNLTSLDCVVKNKSEIENNKFDGIVINNLDYELDSNLMKYLYDILNDEGSIFIILRLKKVNFCFDDDKTHEEVELLKESIKNIYEINTELIGDSSWKFFIITKKHY